MENNVKECGCYAPEWSADDNVTFPGHTCDACEQAQIRKRNMVIVYSYTPENDMGHEHPLEQDFYDDLPF